MSLVCPIAKCKEQKGPCVCEKVMSVLVAIVLFVGVYRHIILQP